jgi:UDP-glucose 4-epimerase
MKLLVTGGAGFVGSNLVSHLSKTGSYDIVVLDNFSVGQKFMGILDNVQVIRGDFTDRTTLTQALFGVDAIVHLAALSGVIDSIDNPIPSFKTNVEGTVNLLELARQANLKRFINASTGGAIMGEVIPPISEEMPPSPLSPYGASKLAIEGYCSAFSGAYGMSCVNLRFSNLYGPISAHKKSVIAMLIKKAISKEMINIFGNGMQTRDYLFIGDLVTAIHNLLQSDASGTFQLGSGVGTPLLSVLGMVQDLAKDPLNVQFLPSRAGEIHNTWCNIDKAKRMLGYSAPTILETGIKKTWDWYLENQHIWISNWHER